jgi:hypothetical protein
MKKLLPIYLLAVLVYQHPMSALATEAYKPLRFSAMGCGPYNLEDQVAIRFYLKRENAVKVKSEFLIHLGDIVSGKDARAGMVDAPYYAQINTLFTTNNVIPTYIVPGDNEWNDHVAPTNAWKWWSTHFLALEKNFPEPAWETERQTNRTENFAFVHQGIQFIGINLVGGRIHDAKEWAQRFEDNNDWIAAQLSAETNTLRGAVIFCQANPIGQGKKTAEVKKTFAPFTDRMVPICKAFEKPILFLHADGHTWTVDHPFKAAPNVTRVQVDRINPQFPPVRITVTPTTPPSFKFDRRLNYKAWIAPNRPAPINPATKPAHKK